MERNHRDDPGITSLGRFWDDMLTGRPAAPRDLDPALAEAVRRLHARDDGPEMDATFVARLTDQLEEHMQAMYRQTARVDDPLGWNPPRRVTDRDRTAARSVAASTGGARPPRGWNVPHVVSAALVAVTLVIAVLALGPTRGNGPEPRRTEGPAAIVVSGTPGPTVQADEVLATVVLPAGTLPAEVIGGLNQYTVAAGSQATWDWTCCTGIRLDYILQGTYTVRGSGPMLVQRAGASEAWAEAAPDTTIVLEAGDALLSRMEDRFEATNSSSAPVELLDVVLFTGVPTDDPVPYQASGQAAWQVLDQDIWGAPVAVATDSLRLQLRHTVIDATSELPPPPGALLQLAVSSDEGAVPSTQDEFVVKNFGAVPISVHVLSLEPMSGATPAATP